MDILHPDYSLCDTLLLSLKAQPWESESWVSHPGLSPRWVEIVNLGQWMILIPQSLEFSWGFLESMLVKYLLAMTKGTGPLNMRESRTYNRSHMAWMIIWQHGFHSRVPLLAKICSPGGVCPQVSSGLWETQALVMWTLGLHVSVTVGWCHGCDIVCFRTCGLSACGKKILLWAT